MFLSDPAGSGPPRAKPKRRPSWSSLASRTRKARMARRGPTRQPAAAAATRSSTLASTTSARATATRTKRARRPPRSERPRRRRRLQQPRRRPCLPTSTALRSATLRTASAAAMQVRRTRQAQVTPHFLSHVTTVTAKQSGQLNSGSLRQSAKT